MNCQICQKRGAQLHQLKKYGCYAHAKCLKQLRAEALLYPNFYGWMLYHGVTVGIENGDVLLIGGLAETGKP